MYVAFALHHALSCSWIFLSLSPFSSNAICFHFPARYASNAACNLNNGFVLSFGFSTSTAPRAVMYFAINFAYCDSPPDSV